MAEPQSIPAVPQRTPPMVCVVPDKLQNQYDDIISSKPPYLKQIGQFYTPVRTVSMSGDLIPIVDAIAGPWFLDVTLNISCLEVEEQEGMADDGTIYYPQDHRIRLEFAREGPPRVFFLSTIRHFQITMDGLLPPPCYNFYKGDTMRQFFEFLATFLKRPLHPCDHCNEAFAKPAKHNLEDCTIIEMYKPHRQNPALFDAPAGWKKEWFHPNFWNAISHAKAGNEGPLRALLQPIEEDVYTCPMFTNEFCDALCAELDHFQTTGLPAARPNSMNNYGLILNKLGFEPIMDRLQQEFLKPMFRYLFPNVGIDVDKHHTFTVQYKPNEDRGLDMHTDDSHITLNVCLGKEFTGAKLTFCGFMGKKAHRKFRMEYSHVKGQALIHLGRHRHGAQDIKTGERVNLIIWSKSSTFGLSKQYKMEGTYQGYTKETSPPDAMCLSYTHDRDYTDFLPLQPGMKIGNAWCPPPGKEYDTFNHPPKVDYVPTVEELRKRNN